MLAAVLLLLASGVAPLLVDGGMSIIALGDAGGGFRFGSDASSLCNAYDIQNFRFADVPAGASRLQTSPTGIRLSYNNGDALAVCPGVAVTQQLDLAFPLEFDTAVVWVALSPAAQQAPLVLASDQYSVLTGRLTMTVPGSGHALVVWRSVVSVPAGAAATVFYAQVPLTYAFANARNTSLGSFSIGAYRVLATSTSTSTTVRLDTDDAMLASASALLASANRVPSSSVFVCVVTPTADGAPSANRSAPQDTAVVLIGLPAVAASMRLMHLGATGWQDVPSTVDVAASTIVSASPSAVAGAWLVVDSPPPPPQRQTVSVYVGLAVALACLLAVGAILFVVLRRLYRDRQRDKQVMSPDDLIRIMEKKLMLHETQLGVMQPV